jgi:hypothetical protein
MNKLIIALSLLLFTACEPIPEVRISGGNPPGFRLAGETDTLEFFICCKEPLQPIERENYLWSISIADPNDKLRLDLIYGVIPRGYKQTIPEQNTVPQALVEGRVYTYWAQGIYGGKVGCFEIRNSKAVEANCENRGGKLTGELSENEKLLSFKISGDDPIYELLIYYVDSTNKDVGKWTRPYVWQIRPENEFKKRLPAEIVFGTLPEGYKQLWPTDGKHPQKLRPGIRYHFDIRGINSSSDGCFEVIHDRIAKVVCP